MRRCRWLFPRVLLATCAVLVAMPVYASEPSVSLDLSGQQIAEGLCAACHAIGRADESENPNAPPFRTFAQKWPLEYLEEALAEGIVVGHEGAEMPEYTLEPSEIDALLGYMETIQVPAE